MDYEYTRWLLAHVGYRSNKCLNDINFKHKINAILKRVTPSSRDARKKGVKHSKRTFETMSNEWSTGLKSFTGSHLPHCKTSSKGWPTITAQPSHIKATRRGKYTNTKEPNDHNHFTRYWP